MACTDGFTPIAPTSQGSYRLLEIFPATANRRPNSTDSKPLTLASKVPERGGMHIPIERLHEFVMGLLDLTEAEQAHLVRCSFCVSWLDACVLEKVSLLIDSHRHN